MDITPRPSELPKQFLGILDKLYSRAIVIDNGATKVALVTVDVISMPDPMCERLIKRISTELGIPADNIVIAGTGTHSIPMGKPGQVPLPGGNIEPSWPIDNQIVESVKLAKEKLQPARMGYGTGVSYINVQRDRIDPDADYAAASSRSRRMTSEASLR